MLSRLSIYPFLIQLCHTFTLYWLSIRLHSLINAIPCFLPFLYFCVTDKCAISCNNTLFSFSSLPTILLLTLMDGFLTRRFLSISNSNMPTIVLKLLLRKPRLTLFSLPSKYNWLYSSNRSCKSSFVIVMNCTIAFIKYPGILVHTSYNHFDALNKIIPVPHIRTANISKNKIW